MEQDLILQKALPVFIRYGFRKTSMDDVAQAVGLSRQALYKRFDSKDDLFRSVIGECLARAEERALATLRDENLSLEDRLLAAFDAYVGVHIDDLRASPHGFEVIAMANAQVADEAAESERRFTALASKALMAIYAFTDQRQAEDAVFAMACASRGLVHKAATRDDYLVSLRRVIGAALPPQLLRGEARYEPLRLAGETGA